MSSVKPKTEDGLVKSSSAQMRHPAVKYGYPMSTHIRYFTNHVVAFDPSRRNPLWVQEHVTKESSSGPGDRKYSNFFEEDSLEPRFRNRLGDFKGSGYDRGHMAPAQDHKGSQKAMDETHSMINISPQVGKGFNRDYWSRFESFTKRLASPKGTEVFVVTGPLFIPKRSPNGKGWVMNHPVIGEPPGMVSVPTHFFKVILVEQSPKDNAQQPGGKTISCGAFVMPNGPIDPATPLEAFAVPLTRLETVSGLQFFPALISTERREQLDSSALKVQAAGKALLRAPSAPLLLTDGDSDSSGATTKAGSRATPSQEGPLPPLAVTKPEAKHQHPVHLCEQFACKLPAEDFWMSNNSKRGGDIKELTNADDDVVE